jgi:hypothetical protein
MPEIPRSHTRARVRRLDVVRARVRDQPRRLDERAGGGVASGGGAAVGLEVRLGKGELRSAVVLVSSRGGGGRGGWAGGGLVGGGLALVVRFGLLGSVRGTFGDGTAFTVNRS